MSDPVTWIAIIQGIIAIAGAASDYMSGDAAYGAQIDAEKYNRELLRRQASNEALVASLNEDAQRREAAFAQSRTRAGLIEAGIGTAKGGSAVAVSGQAAKFAELDALNIRWEGNAQRTSLLSQADLVQYGIEGIRSQRSAAKFQSILGGAQGVAGAVGGAMGGGATLQKAPAGTGTSMPKAGFSGSPSARTSGITRYSTTQRAAAMRGRPVATSYRPSLN